MTLHNLPYQEFDRNMISYNFLYSIVSGFALDALFGLQVRITNNFHVHRQLGVDSIDMTLIRLHFALKVNSTGN